MPKGDTGQTKLVKSEDKQDHGNQKDDKQDHGNQKKDKHITHNTITYKNE